MLMKSKLSLLALGITLFVAGVYSGGHLDSLQAAPQAKQEAVKTIGLGSPCADLVRYKGAPSKIDFGPDCQVWFYVTKDKVFRPSYTVHNGIVVLIH